MKAVPLLMGCMAGVEAQAQSRGVYNDLTIALQQRDKVRVLDLRGQHLRGLPDSLDRLQNVEAILVGMKLRNLWLYPPAWKYKFHLQHLPAGGYLHIQNRGGRSFYSFNSLKVNPSTFCRFPKLRVLDIDGGVSFSAADTIASRMQKCSPQVIVLGGDIHPKDPDADFTGYF